MPTPKLDSVIRLGNKNYQLLNQISDSLHQSHSTHIANYIEKESTGFDWQTIVLPFVVLIITILFNQITDRIKNYNRLKDLKQHAYRWIFNTIEHIRLQISDLENLRKSFASLDLTDHNYKIVVLDVDRIVNLKQEDLYSMFVILPKSSFEENDAQLYQLLINLQTIKAMIVQQKDVEYKKMEEQITKSIEKIELSRKHVADVNRNAAIFYEGDEIKNLNEYERNYIIDMVKIFTKADSEYAKDLMSDLKRNLTNKDLNNENRSHFSIELKQTAMKAKYFENNSPFSRELIDLETALIEHKNAIYTYQNLRNNIYDTLPKQIELFNNITSAIENSNNYYMQKGNISFIEYFFFYFKRAISKLFKK